MRLSQCEGIIYALQGMLNAQLEHLARVLTYKRIWALNVDVADLH